VKLPSQDELKHLQVKAELTKLPDVPRAYNEKLQMGDSMNIDGNN
jgi:hypothetical protein